MASGKKERLVMEVQCSRKNGQNLITFCK